MPCRLLLLTTSITKKLISSHVEKERVLIETTAVNLSKEQLLSPLKPSGCEYLMMKHGFSMESEFKEIYGTKSLGLLVTILMDKHGPKHCCYSHYFEPCRRLLKEKQSALLPLFCGHIKSVLLPQRCEPSNLIAT